MDREVIRCQVCGLRAVPRTRTDGQLPSLVLRLLPPKVTLRHSDAVAYRFAEGTTRQLFENLGRIEKLSKTLASQYPAVARIAQSMTQSQLTSTLTRFAVIFVADRKRTDDQPRCLGTLEKIAEALGVGLNRCFFVPETNGETGSGRDPFYSGAPVRSCGSSIGRSGRGITARGCRPSANCM